MTSATYLIHEIPKMCEIPIYILMILESELLIPNKYKHTIIC